MRRVVQVAPEYPDDVGAANDFRERGLAFELEHGHRPEQWLRDRWMMDRDQRSVWCRSCQDAGKPFELGGFELAVMVSRHGGIE